MSRDCVHQDYKLDPVFTGPVFEKSHVYFSAALELHSVFTAFSWIFGCSEREHEVISTLDCMRYLYPAPTGWNSDSYVIDLNAEKRLKGYCVNEGKAVVTYQRPERHFSDYKSILKDVCEGYVIVESYNSLKSSTNFFQSTFAIPYHKMKEYYDSECSLENYRNIEEKPSFCVPEYRFDNNGSCMYYRSDCADNILQTGVTYGDCKDSIRPEYRTHKDSYSYHGHLARLAAMSYQDRIMMLDGGWKHIGRSPENSDGFFGHAFTNDDLKVTAIVFRGTDDLSKDWMGSNICFAPPGCRPDQYKVALDFFDSVSSNADYEHIVSGHSLGGALAQLVSIARGVKAVTFDSPGTQYAAKNLFYSRKINSASDQITSYIFGFNLVNSAGKHIIDPIQITKNIIEDCDKFFAVGNTFSQHEMSKAAEEYFDLLSGRPLYTERISKEKLGVSYAREQFLEKCKKEIKELQGDLFDCAKMLFETNGVLSHRDHLLIFDDSIRMNKYLPVLKKANGPCGLISTEQISKKEYENRIELSKAVAVNQAKYDLPMPIEDSGSHWSERPYNDVLNVHMLDFVVNLDRDANYYTKKILENSDVRQKYTVVDCRDPDSQLTICKTILGIADSHDEL